MRIFGWGVLGIWLLWGGLTGCTSQQIGETAWDTKTDFQNGLVGMPGPFHQLHAYQPIDWIPWDATILQEADRLGMPLLIHTGYAGSYQAWQVAQSSMMDTLLAAEINKHFLPVLVDQEIHPDFWRHLAQSIGPNSPEMGTLILAPSGAVIAQYTGPAANWASFVARHFRSTGSVSQASYGGPTPSSTRWRAGALLQLEADLQAALDQKISHKTLAGSPFPGKALDHLLSLQLPASELPNSTPFRALEIFRKSALYDHLNGGLFARMSLGEEQGACFAKRLPDQVAAISAWTHACARIPHPSLALPLEQTVAFVLDNMRQGNGGYIASLGAESQQEDGRYYLWSDIDVRHVLGDQADYFATYYDIRQEGNWQEGLNLLYQPLDEQAIAAGYRIRPIELRGIMDQAREKMLAERARRAAPKRDEKILIHWNAQLSVALLRAGMVLSNSDAVQAGQELISWLYSRAQKPEGGLIRFHFHGNPYGEGQLEDYASLSQACFQWYMYSLDSRWLERGLNLLEEAIPRFYIASTGQFDNQVAGSGWGPLSLAPFLQGQPQRMMGSSLLLASRLADRPRYRQLAGALLDQVRPALQSDPYRYADWMILLKEWVRPEPLIQVAPRHQKALMAFLASTGWVPMLTIGSDQPLPDDPFNGPVWQAGTPDEAGRFRELAERLRNL